MALRQATLRRRGSADGSQQRSFSRASAPAGERALEHWKRTVGAVREDGRLRRGTYRCRLVSRAPSWPGLGLCIVSGYLRASNLVQSADAAPVRCLRPEQATAQATAAQTTCLLGPCKPYRGGAPRLRHCSWQSHQAKPNEQPGWVVLYTVGYEVQTASAVTRRLKGYAAAVERIRGSSRRGHAREERDAAEAGGSAGRSGEEL